MVDDVKEVLVFISYAFHKFLANALLYFVYFLSATAVTLVLFILNHRVFGHLYFFVLYLLVLVVVNLKIRRMVLSRYQLVLNLMFIRFLEKKQDFSRDVKAGSLRKRFKEIKESLKAQGIGFSAHKLLLAAAAYRLAREQGEGSDSAGLNNLAGMKKRAFTYLSVQVLLFIGLLVPFVLISLFLTQGFPARIQLLVYLLGVFFAYFLHAAMFDPLFYLTLQKKYIDEMGLGK